MTKITHSKNQYSCNGLYTSDGMFMAIIEGLDQKISPDLSLRVGGTLGARCFHLRGTSDNLVHMDSNNVELIKT